SGDEGPPPRGQQALARHGGECGDCRRRLCDRGADQARRRALKCCSALGAALVLIFTRHNSTLREGERALLTVLMRSRFQTPLCLRQHGTSYFICFSFFRSQSEKTKNKRR